VGSLLVLALIFAGAVSAQGRWEFVATNREGSRWYIDRESIITLSPGRYLIWQNCFPVGTDRQKYLERELKGIKNAENFEYTKSRLEIDCASMKHRYHSSIYYTGDDHFIKMESAAPSEWYDYVPESAGWMFVERFCTKVYDAKEM
jgi:hypothetical protein